MTLPEGWAPISESTGADKAYIILDGTVSVRSHGEEVARLGPGDIVGEAAILNHSLRTATIVALTPLELIHFTKDAAATGWPSRCRRSTTPWRRPRPSGSRSTTEVNEQTTPTCRRLSTPSSATSSAMRPA